MLAPHSNSEVPVGEGSKFGGIMLRPRYCSHTLLPLGNHHSPRKGENEHLNKKYKLQAFVLSVHKPAARLWKRGLAVVGALRVPLFFPSSCSLFLLSSSLKTLLLHSLLYSLSLKLPLKLLSYHTHALSILSQKHSDDPRKFTTKHFIQTNLPASILQTSTQYKPQETNEIIKTKCKPR